MKTNSRLLAIALLWIFASQAMTEEPTSKKVWRNSADIFNNVDREEYRHIVHADFSDEEWPSSYVLSYAPNLQTLALGGPRFTDDLTLPSIEKLESLRTLILDSTDVTNEGIAKLQSKRPNLLVLRSQRWAIAKIQQLSPEMVMRVELDTRHPDLRKLLGDAHFQRVTRVDTGHLPREVERAVARFLNEELMPVKYLDSVKYLDLTWWQVNDAGIQYFKECKNLEFLTLPVGQVSDEGLKSLKKLRKLKTIRIQFPRYVGYPHEARKRYEQIQEAFSKRTVNCLSLDNFEQQND